MFFYSPIPLNEAAEQNDSKVTPSLRPCGVRGLILQGERFAVLYCHLVEYMKTALCRDYCCVLNSGTKQLGRFTQAIYFSESTHLRYFTWTLLYATDREVLFFTRFDSYSYSSTNCGFTRFFMVKQFHGP